MSEAQVKEPTLTAGDPPPSLVLTDRPKPRQNARRSGPTPEQQAAVRADLHRQHHDNQRAGQQADEAPEEKEAPPEPREDLDSIEIKLPDGRMIEFGPPPGISMTTKIAQMTAGREPSQSLDLIARVCLCVRSIEGKRRPEITSMIDVHKVANILGDNALDGLAVLLNRYWPPIKVSELLIIKKNQRGS